MNKNKKSLVFLILFIIFINFFCINTLAIEKSQSYSFLNYEKIYENCDYNKKENIKNFIKQKELEELIKTMKENNLKKLEANQKEQQKEIVKENIEENKAKNIEKNIEENIEIKEETNNDENLIEISEMEVPLSSSSNIQDFNITEISQTFYGTTCVNIREQPSKNSKSIGLLNLNEEILVTGICDNGWDRVDYNGNIAYINASYLSDSKIEVINEPQVIEPNIQNSQDVQEQVPQNNGYNGVIRRNGNVPDSRLYKLENYYCMVPQSIRTKLETAGWIICCSDEDFGAKYGYNYSILALTVYNEKYIYIKNSKSAEQAIIHEVGHAIDSYFGFVSSSEEFLNIFNQEKDIFCSVYYTHSNNTSTPIEYFAESFEVAILNPSLVQNNCPMTYEFLMRYANS